MRIGKQRYQNSEGGSPAEYLESGVSSGRLAVATTVFVAVLLFVPIVTAARSVNDLSICPLCPAIGAQTIGEGLTTSDVSVFVKLLELREEPAEKQPNARFEIIDVLFGEAMLKGSTTIEMNYYGSRPIGTEFLISATDPLKLTWGDPVVMSPRAKDYVRQVKALPEDPKKRLKFFLNRLEDADEVIASDAYDEFARAPYDEVLAIQGEYNKGELLQWMQNEEIPMSRRRLYFMLLGVCGGSDEAPIVKRLVSKAIEHEETGLDSMIACYLSLAGADGLPFIEQKLLANHESGYSQTYSAIMALRFHGTDSDVIEQKRIVKSFRLLLDRPSLADLIIPDLARWKDWESADVLAKLFKEATPENRFIRVPIVVYMQLCPLPKAEGYLEEFRKLDAKSVERAELAFPFG